MLDFQRNHRSGVFLQGEMDIMGPYMGKIAWIDLTKGEVSIIDTEPLAQRFSAERITAGFFYSRLGWELSHSIRKMSSSSALELWSAHLLPLPARHRLAR